MNPSALLLITLAVATLLRWVLAAVIELSPDEVYYRLWSQHLDYCYYSKGPGVAAVIKLGIAIAGDNALGIRLFAPLLSAGTSVVTFLLTRRLFGLSPAIWTVIALNFLPIFNVGSVLMTIDPLSIFFWVAAMLAFFNATHQADGSLRDPQAAAPAATGWWITTGVLTGLGFLCKWTNAASILSMIAYLALRPQSRRFLKSRNFLWMLASFLLFTIPPIVWNAQHQWITLTHLGERSGAKQGFRIAPQELLAFLGSQFGVYSPVWFGILCLAVTKTIRAPRLANPARYLLCFGLPITLSYCLLSLNKAGQPNWAAPGIVSLAMLVGAWWISQSCSLPHHRKWTIAAFATAWIMSAVVMDTDLLRKAGIPLPHERDPGSRQRGWISTASAIQQTRNTFETESNQSVFLISSRYQTCAELSHYMRPERVEGAGHPQVYIPESPIIANQFAFFPRYDEFFRAQPGQESPDPEFSQEVTFNPFIGRTALFINDRGDEVPSAISACFETVTPLDCFDVIRRGQPLRRIVVYACEKYRARSL
jgi:hypothetical protein